jgi:hypothetical protein
MGYSIGDFKFVTEDFFPLRVKDMITEIRVDSPDVIISEALARVRRPKLTTDGKLTVLATDHPARLVTNVGNDPMAMADRLEYLGRVLRVLVTGEFDGVMGPTDIIEDLFIVSHLIKQAGGPAFLDEKVILGCMNRGGLSGVVFEMDDRMTSFTADSIAQLRLDGAKIMFRLDDNEVSSLSTIEYCAWAITEMNAHGLPTFLEPLPVELRGGKYEVQKNAEALARTAGVAGALGDSSANLWLKLPYCDDYEIVSRAVTEPILMLGGASKGDPTPMLGEFASGMRAGSNVRGALVGRNILYPGADDPLATAEAVHKIVHQGYTADQAAEYIMENRGRDMDALTKWLS